MKASPRSSRPSCATSRSTFGVDYDLSNRHVEDTVLRWRWSARSPSSRSSRSATIPASLQPGHAKPLRALRQSAVARVGGGCSDATTWSHFFTSTDQPSRRHRGPCRHDQASTCSTTWAGVGRFRTRRRASACGTSWTRCPPLPRFRATPNPQRRRHRPVRAVLDRYVGEWVTPGA